jgi:hypothetical protein
MSTLVVVPCGRAKIWKRYPTAGPTPAERAYVGSPFIVNRNYARRIADSWVVLSAKYGYILPAFMIPGDYNVSFKDPRSNPIDLLTLRQQVEDTGLRRFDTVLGLGGKEYREILRESFAPKAVEFPFAGLDLFATLRATNEASHS